MAALGLGWLEFLNFAHDLKCYDVEFRNEFANKLFDGVAPEKVAKSAKDLRLRILELAEVKAFNAWSDAKRIEAKSLIKIAKACGAEQLSLIARHDNLAVGPMERQSNLITALSGLNPLFSRKAILSA